MTFKEIQELIKLLSKSNLAEFKLKDGDFELTLRTDLFSETKTTRVITAPAPVMPVAATPVAAIHDSTAAPATPAPSGDLEKPAEALAQKADAAINYLEIKSPMVGTFYRSSTPEKPAYVEVGQKIKKGDIVCIIEAMKLFNEIESEVSGTIVKVMVDNALPVEYDQVLFLVEP